MKFYTGDIVEILNLSSDQVYSIRSQRCNFNIDVVREVVGMRYRIEVKTDDYGDWVIIPFWNHGGHLWRFETSQVMLYHRPWRNWVRMFVDTIKGSFSR